MRKACRFLFVGICVLTLDSIFSGRVFAFPNSAVESGEPPLTAPLPDNTLPMTVADPVLPDHPNDQPGFACYGACGRSCDCVGRVDGTRTTEFNGKTCQWRTVSCKTHDFCRWHDTCYNRCDFQFPGRVSDGSNGRWACYRSCDASCIGGSEVGPITGWKPESLDPGPYPSPMGAIQCYRRLADYSSIPFDGVLTYAELIGCN